MVEEIVLVRVSAVKPSKLHNIKTTIDGIKFSSKLEANRYCELVLLQKAGEVKEIELQPRFLLQEGFKKNGETFRPIYYVADFKVTYKDGHVEVEDTKGMRTEVYKLKRKLFEFKYPDLSIREVS
jgi:hypothetical protein